LRRKSPYKHTRGLFGWNFSTNGCIPVNIEILEALKPILELLEERKS